MFRARELEVQPDVVLRRLEQLRELADRGRRIARVQVRRREPAPSLGIGRIAFETVPHLRDEPLEVSRVEVRDLEVPRRDLHPRVQLERSLEGGDRLLVQTLLVVDHTQVVVRARIARVDPAPDRTEDLEIPRRTRDRRAMQRAHARWIARRITWSEAGSGMSRKCARTGSASLSIRKTVSRQINASLCSATPAVPLLRTAAAWSIARPGTEVRSINPRQSEKTG